MPPPLCSLPYLSLPAPKCMPSFCQPIRFTLQLTDPVLVGAVRNWDICLLCHTAPFLRQLTGAVPDWHLRGCDMSVLPWDPQYWGAIMVEENHSWWPFQVSGPRQALGHGWDFCTDISGDTHVYTVTNSRRQPSPWRRPTPPGGARETDQQATGRLWPVDSSGVCQ